MTTKESFLLRLGRATNDEHMPGWLDTEIDHPLAMDDGMGVYISSTVSVMSDEFSNFVQEQDTLFMDALTELYDCPRTFEKHTKNSGDDKLSNVAVNLIGGTTPAALSRILPDAAFKQGFASRLNLIYSDESERKSLFGGEPIAFRETLKSLETDLKSIAALRGEFEFTREAAKALDDWYMQGMKPAPDHPRLATYNERRHIHLVKLMMIVSASRRSDLTLTVDDLIEATTILLESEAIMPGVLNKMGHTDESSNYEDAVAFLASHYRDKKIPMVEVEFRAYLVRKFPAQQVRQIVEELILAGWITAEGKPGGRLFTPGPKVQ